MNLTHPHPRVPTMLVDLIWTIRVPQAIATKKSMCEVCAKFIWLLIAKPTLCAFLLDIHLYGPFSWYTSQNHALVLLHGKTSWLRRKSFSHGPKTIQKSLMATKQKVSIWMLWHILHIQPFTEIILVPGNMWPSKTRNLCKVWDTRISVMGPMKLQGHRLQIKQIQPEVRARNLEGKQT